MQEIAFYQCRACRRRIALEIAHTSDAPRVLCCWCWNEMGSTQFIPGWKLESIPRTHFKEVDAEHAQWSKEKLVTKPKMTQMTTRNVSYTQVTAPREEWLALLLEAQGHENFIDLIRIQDAVLSDIRTVTIDFTAAEWSVLKEFAKNAGIDYDFDF